MNPFSTLSIIFFNLFGNIVLVFFPTRKRGGVIEREFVKGLPVAQREWRRIKKKSKNDVAG